MLNFTPVSNRNPKLGPIDPQNRKHFGEFITFKGSGFYISDSLWTKMGYPDYVQFAIDENEKVLGIKKTDKDDPYSISIKMGSSGGSSGSAAVIADRILALLPFEIDYKIHNVTLLRGYKVDEFFCFDFSKAEKKDVKKQKKKV